MFSHICLVLSRAVFFIYISIIYPKYKPSCISESYYLLKHKWIFTLWVILIAFLTLPSWLDASPDNFQFLAFLSSISLIGIGIAPRYLENDRKIHISSTCFAALFSLIWTVITGFYILPIILSIVLLILYIIKIPNILFWIETSAFLNIFISINPTF